MKGRYIEITDPPDFDKMQSFTYSQIKGPKKDNPFNVYVSRERRRKAGEPNQYKNYSGVYFLMDGKELVYIGKTTQLSVRIKDHKQDIVSQKDFDSLFFLPLKEGWEMDVLERIYIELYKPKYNK